MRQRRERNGWFEDGQSLARAKIERIRHVTSSVRLLQYNHRHSEVDDRKGSRADEHDGSSGHLSDGALATKGHCARGLVGYGQTALSIQVAKQHQFGNRKHECYKFTDEWFACESKCVVLTNELEDQHG